MTISVKICGIKTRQALTAAIDGGADYLGSVFYPPSPRYVSPAEAGALGQDVPVEVKKVAITVNADDDLLDEIVAYAATDLIQLHGSESPDRIAHIRQRFKLPVIKAVSISTPDDILIAHQFETCADMILFDAKPPKDMPDALPGGNGLAFDWALIAADRWKVPWLLSGGLTADNVSEAINTSGTNAVDVSSGVEREPGDKDPDLIRRFLNAAKQK
jgi:phosphoribosylanthranilate isomerase